jgi:hypothetical protein
VKAIKIEKTPALLDDAVSRASSGLSNRTPTSDAGVEARLTQLAAIVKGDLDPDSVSARPNIRFSPLNAVTPRRPDCCRFPCHSGAPEFDHVGPVKPRP